MSILAYIVRHGGTDAPGPEYWEPWPLNPLGLAQAKDAAQWLNVKADKKPDWGVTSDLVRHKETLDVVTKTLGIKTVRSMLELRSINKDESPEHFEKRSERAFNAVLLSALASKTIPVIVTSRSNIAWLLGKYGHVRQRINYNDTGLMHAGGVAVLNSDKTMVGVYKKMDANDDNNLFPSDGTHVAGFVTAKVNEPPRECGNCRWMDENYCINPIVTADDELGVMFGKKRNAKNFWIVKEDDCCDNFQNVAKGKLKPAPTPRIVVPER